MHVRRRKKDFWVWCGEHRLERLHLKCSHSWATEACNEGKRNVQLKYLYNNVTPMHQIVLLNMGSFQLIWKTNCNKVVLCFFFLFFFFFWDLPIDLMWKHKKTSVVLLKLKNRSVIWFHNLSFYIVK